MLKANLADPADGKSANVARTTWGNVLYVTGFEKLNGRFKAATRTTDGTTIITEPDSGGSISLTDLIVTTEKRAAGGHLTLRFTDGTNTINIAVVNVIDAPANFGIGLSGRWQGWINARLEMVTDEDFSATVSAGYLKVSPKYTLLFTAWDEQR